MSSVLRIAHRAERRSLAEHSAPPLCPEVPVMMIAIDYTGVILDANAAWETRFGHRRGDVVGIPIAQLAGVGKENPLEALKTTSQTLLALHTRGGERVEVEIHASGPTTDQRGVMLLTLHDLTERNAPLATPEVAHSARDHFAQLAAHDLQAPIRHIDFLAQVVEEELALGNMQRTRENVGHIREVTSRMADMVRALLEISQTATEGIVAMPVDLKDLVQDVLVDNACQILSTGAEIHTEHMPVIACDAALIRSVLQNLISNALKYHHADTPPTIGISTRTEQWGWRVSVEDDGIGVPADCRDRIFEPLNRLHGPDSAYPGSGLGLATCKKIVLAHGGAIWAEAAPGGGSRFIFTIPAPGPDHASRR